MFGLQCQKSCQAAGRVERLLYMSSKIPMLDARCASALQSPDGSVDEPLVAETVLLSGVGTISLGPRLSVAPLKMMWAGTGATISCMLRRRKVLALRLAGLPVNQARPLRACCVHVYST